MEISLIKKVNILVYLILSAGFFSVHAASDEFEIDLDTMRAISPEPGTIISEQNFEKYANLLDAEFVEKFIKTGWVTLAVGDTFSLRPHENFVTASVNNMGKATLGDEPGILNGYVAGRPFSSESLKIEDENSGTKLIWNMRYGYAGDGGRIPEMYWQYRDMRKQELERELAIQRAVSGIGGKIGGFLGGLFGGKERTK